MEELSIQEKASRYDEAIEKAKSKIKNDKNHVLYEDDVIDIFPELQKSGEEKIREEIIRIVDIWTNSSPVVNGITRETLLAWLEKEGEQKSAWSEEDENRFRNLIFLVEHSNEGKGTKKGFIKFIYRLKSLKERYTWKPSDEQMSVLDAVIDEYNGYPEFDSLVSLKNDLKKLKG